MSAKHTPGPWKASLASSVVGSLIASDQNGVACNVAAVMPQVGRRSRIYDPEETMANANLVAAAPDLLEAIEALGVMPDGYCFCPGSLRDPQKPEHEHTGECRMARDAIAKADGRFSSSR